MSMNSHKGRIENLDEGLIEKISAEVEELRDALVGNDPLTVIEEAGDILNFLVAAVHQATLQYRNRK